MKKNIFKASFHSNNFPESAIINSSGTPGIPFDGIGNSRISSGSARVNKPKIVMDGAFRISVGGLIENQAYRLHGRVSVL